MVLILPQLPGLAWPVDVDFGGFDTTIETSVSGKETRYINRVQARRHYSLAYDALDSSGGNAGIVANSLQTLAGFFNQCFGGGLMFKFWDATDCAASGEQFGVGDGSTRTFQLAKSDGGWVDNVFAPFVATTLTLIPSAAAPSNPNANVYAPNNLVAYSATPETVPKNGLTAVGGQADPFGGTTAAIFTETETSVIHYSQWTFTSVPGVPIVVSGYFKQSGAEQYTSFFVDRQSGSGGAEVTIDMVNGLVTKVASFGTSTGASAGIVSAGGGWWRAWVSILCDPAINTLRFGVMATNNLPTPATYPNYLGSTSNSFLFAAPQVEVSTAGVPSAYVPTSAARYYGSPVISAAGAWVDPAGYSINANTGLVTFTSAPTSGAALTWSGNFYWWANFDDDKFAASQFMGGLWEAKKLGFTTRVF